MRPRCVLVTGATGFLGMELLVRLIEQEDTRVIALVRAADRSQARERIAGVLARLYQEPPNLDGRLLAVPGDVTVETLGLSLADLRTIRASVTSVAHCAGAISFDLHPDEAFNINALGTARMLDLACSCSRLEQFLHVSTAYVAGDKRGSFREIDLDRGQRFHNSYEWSKFSAEHVVGQASASLPTLIVRPSIVVGDRRSGWTPNFNVIYWPLRAYARGLVSELPVDPDGLVDIVPVDYVADACAHLVRHPDLRGRLSLVAGQHVMTNAELGELAAAWFGVSRPRLAPGAALPKLDEIRLFRPYFEVHTRFDDRRARQLLEPTGIQSSPVADYFPALMGYAERSAWGKRPLTRDAALAGAARQNSWCPGSLLNGCDAQPDWAH
jgi:thioester reductase-like protein